MYASDQCLKALNLNGHLSAKLADAPKTGHFEAKSLLAVLIFRDREHYTQSGSGN
jgi:hypothetical protein